MNAANIKPHTKPTPEMDSPASPSNLPFSPLCIPTDLLYSTHTPSLLLFSSSTYRRHPDFILLTLFKSTFYPI
jgi:hypothetical protein